MKRTVCLLLIGLLLCLSGAAFAAVKYPQEAKTTESAVEVHKTARANSTVLVRLRKGTAVTVTGEKTVGSAVWYEVTLKDGTSGFVQGDVLSMETAKGTPKKATPEPKKTVKVTKMPVTVEVRHDGGELFNHIGTNWFYTYELNGKTVDPEKGTADFTAGREYTFRTVIEERDGKPDVGENTVTYTPTEADIKNGFTVRQKVTVSENGGRFSGNMVTFTVTWKINK